MYSRCKFRIQSSPVWFPWFPLWQWGFTPYLRCIPTAAYFPPLGGCNYPRNVLKSHHSHLKSDSRRAFSCHPPPSSRIDSGERDQQSFFSLTLGNLGLLLLIGGDKVCAGKFNKPPGNVPHLEAQPNAPDNDHKGSRRVSQAPRNHRLQVRH